MKIQNVSGFLTFLLLLGLCLSSCGPTAQVESLYNQFSTNIMGGQNLNYEFQKEHGIVGVLVTYRKTGANGQVEDEFNATCTGLLISKRQVLTAEHCLSGTLNGADFYSMKIFFSSSISFTSKEFIYISAVKPNFKYRPVSIGMEGEAWNDTLVLVLAEEAPDYYKPAILRGDVSPQVGDELLIAGFGITSTGAKDARVLRYIDKLKITQVRPDQKEILVGIKGSDKGACHGDSGGPAFFKENGYYTAVGIASRTPNPKGECDGETIYTRIQEYLPWILQQSI